jgi:hypothetical protein
MKSTIDPTRETLRQMEHEILALTDVRAMALGALRQISKMDETECTLEQAKTTAARHLALIEELEAH